MHEVRGAPEVPLAQLLPKLSPVDLVLVEGFKAEGHEKLECHRAEAGKAVLAKADATIIAVASDVALDIAQVVFDLNDTQKIADFILARVGLG